MVTVPFSSEKYVQGFGCVDDGRVVQEKVLREESRTAFGCASSSSSEGENLGFSQLRRARLTKHHH